MSNNVKALLAWLLGLLGGVVFLVTEKENKLIRLHAAQSVVAFCIYLLASFLLQVVDIFGLSSILSLLYMIIVIVGMVKAYNSEMYKFPVIADIADSMILKEKTSGVSETKQEAKTETVDNINKIVEEESAQDSE